ncbi:uncharacterized protein LOC112876887 [Panicum hallii]|uniref:uncharacterized protein LOC112876887 n=1 Tax=Panicum hallii TaxID=206008 RepID=UPI000DF4EF0E|nr:uncharacterized protein LOC112876887 [Panicum hallii]
MCMKTSGTGTTPSLPEADDKGCLPDLRDKLTLRMENPECQSSNKRSSFGNTPPGSHLVPRDNYFSFVLATPCPVPFFSSHLSSPFPSASVAPGSFRCCRPPPCRFPLLRAFLPASVPHPGDKLPLNSLPYREIKNGVLWGFRGKCWFRMLQNGVLDGMLKNGHEPTPENVRKYYM